MIVFNRRYRRSSLRKRLTIAVSVGTLALTMISGADAHGNQDAIRHYHDGDTFAYQGMACTVRVSWQDEPSAVALCGTEGMGLVVAYDHNTGSWTPWDGCMDVTLPVQPGLQTDPYQCFGTSWYQY